MNNYDPDKSPLVEMKGVIKEYNPRKSFFSRGKNKVLALTDSDLSIQKGEI